MTIIVFDCETTGLLAPIAAGSPYQPYLIELYAIKFDMNLNRLGEYAILVKPPIRIPEDAIKMHGITNERVADEESFAALYEEIAGYFLGSKVLVGHNIMYDKMVLFWELVRLGKEMNFPWAVGSICTAEVSAQYHGHRLNLQDLHIDLFGEGFSGAHAASADCEITAKCFIEMVGKGMIKL